MKTWLMSTLVRAPSWQTLGTVLVVLVAGSCGYYARAFREACPSKLSRQSIEPLEYFVSWKSFSEVDEAKATLQAAAEQFIQGLRTRPIAGVYNAANSSPVTPEAKAACFEKAIQAIEGEIKAFKGTEQEPLLAKELLWLLQRSGNYGRWLEVYLAVLYEHPTHRVVGDFAAQALHVGQITGREPEVQRAFEQLVNLPLEFEGKQQVLLAARSANQVAHHAQLTTKHPL
jgi:hypothetical protein